MKSIAILIALSAVTVAGCPKDAATPAAVEKKAEAPAPAKAPLIAVNAASDWCAEHGVPESQCTRCNASLVDGFKKKGDWCTEHGLPESQCITCHPELKAKFEAMAPKAQAAKP